MKLIHNRLVQLSLFLLLSFVQAGCSFAPIGGGPRSYDPPKPQVHHVPTRDNGAIYQAGMPIGLFDRVTARQIGDIVTIVLKENTNASATANTNATKDQKVDLQSPTLAGQEVLNSNGDKVLENKIDAGREFAGQGTSAKNSSLNGHITVTVSEVQANGNLVIVGQKMMFLNQSDEFIRLTGIIRPQDIRPDNTIDSFRIADVKVAYSGDGALNAANNMGLLARFFQGGIWPY